MGLLGIIVILGFLHVYQLRQDRKQAALEAAEEERILLNRKLRKALTDGVLTPEDLHALGLDPKEFVKNPKYKIWEDG